MKSIICSTEEVQAILDNRKTVTRRVVKPNISDYFEIDVDGSLICFIDRATGDRHDPIKLAKYQVGDILYVRETFFCHDCEPDCAGREDENECPFNRVNNKCYGYKTQYTDSTVAIKWRPSIHMPKDAARIFLKVTKVRIERLQEITEEQAVKEGCSAFIDISTGRVIVSARGKFNILWRSTIKKQDLDKYGWDANPWVWTIEFERIEKP